MRLETASLTFTCVPPPGGRFCQKRSGQRRFRCLDRVAAGGDFRYAARALAEVCMQDLKQFVVDIPDFPKPGILFRDISPLLRRHFGATIEAMEGLFTEREWDAADAVAGIESRGFILASALAERRGKGFVPIRKKGKLPPPVVDIAYDLEYGTGVLEMQAGQGRLLLVDDVLATGGTLTASTTLSRQAGYVVQGVGVLIDIGIAPGFRCEEHVPRIVLQYG
jgi:adenine phosphoribosyltransferase